MWRFLKRNHSENSGEVSVEKLHAHENGDGELQAPDQFHCASNSTAGNKKIGFYDESCLSVDFT